MAIPEWPSALPAAPLKTGYSEQYPNNLLRSSSEAGVAKVRRKGATPPFTISVTFKLSQAQRLILQSFAGETLQDGALRFAFTHPLDGVSFEARLLPDGNSLYKVTPHGIDYLATLELEILP
jgi:hypothetical protein